MKYYSFDTRIKKTSKLEDYIESYDFLGNIYYVGWDLICLFSNWEIESSVSE